MPESSHTRVSTCLCGQLKVTCVGEPFRTSICHCFDCQKRTGSAFGYQARFRNDQFQVEGKSSVYVRVSKAEPEDEDQSDDHVRFHFCPHCASMLYWKFDGLPDMTAVSIGGFSDPQFPAPAFSVYESRQHHWVKVPDEAEHWD